MRVILLAAGLASRLRPLTNNIPKCLLTVGATTILSRTVRLLSGQGLTRITVVDGFCKDQVRDALTAEFPAHWFSFVHNDRYAATDDAWSLWLARSQEREPFLLIDCDVVFEPAVLDRLMGVVHPNSLAVRTDGRWADEEVKVAVDDRGCIVDVSKTLDCRRAVGEAIGIGIFSADCAARLFSILERRMLREQRLNDCYEATFVELIEAGEELHPVYLDGLRSIEIDTAEDLTRAREIFS